jgi:hypothetical protein
MIASTEGPFIIKGIAEMPVLYRRGSLIIVALISG